MNEPLIGRRGRSFAMAATVAVWLATACGASAQEDDSAGGELADGPGLEQLRSARDALIVAADFGAALGPAERVVAELERQDAADPTGDIMRLALIQAELRDFAAAELNYLTVIELLSERHGEFSPTLIEPHRALGRTYIAERRFAEAVAVLEQAQHISQRNEGLFNVDQTALIDDITLAHLGVGDTIQARDLQVQRLENAIRRFGEDDVRVIPFHAALGEYYDRSRLKVSAKKEYERAVAIGASQLGESDSRVLGALRRVAEIDLALGHEATAKERLERVLDQNPELDPLEAGLSLAVLGDWAIANDHAELARSYYLRAFDLVAASAGTDPAAVFEMPRILDFVPPLSSVDRAARARPWAWGTIELRFDVGADGRPLNVETVSMNPPARIESDYNRRLREAHFRPRLVDGMPVATQNVRFTHDFRYYVTE